MINPGMLAGKYMTIMTDEGLSDFSAMMIEHYDKPEYSNTLFLTYPHKLSRQTLPYRSDLLADLDHLKKLYDKIILVDVDHLPFWVMPWHNDDYLDKVDEIWVLWLESFEFFKHNCTKQFDKVRFMPLRWCKSLEKLKLDPHPGNHYTYGLGFTGDLTESRLKILHSVENYYWSTGDPLFIWYGKNIYPKHMKELMWDTKFMLDIPYSQHDYMISQNSIRIFQMIAAGKHILSQRQTFNYFPGMITEFDRFSDLLDIIKYTSPSDYSLMYKEMTYSDEAYEIYKADCIQRFEMEVSRPFDPSECMAWRSYAPKDLEDNKKILE